MPNFKYKAKDAKGKSISGEMMADNQGALATKLKQQRITLVSVANTAGPSTRVSVSTRELAIFSRQFAVMVAAGLPMLQCLSILAEGEPNPKFKAAIGQVREDISQGTNLSDAMSRFTRIWDKLYVNMVRSGEAGGVLQEVMNRLATYIEKSDSLKRKVKGAMMYPTVVSSAALMVVIFLMVTVVPTFETVFASFGTVLPPPTLLLLDMSNFTQKWWWAVVLGVIVLVGGLKLMRRSDTGARLIDGFLLKVPNVGDLLKKVAIAKFARTLSTLIRSGVSIVEALDTTAKTAGNLVIEDAILFSLENIRKGEPLVEPLRAGGLFPAMVCSMVEVGEQTGNLETMLEKVADFYEEEVDVAVDALTSIIEPILIVVMGITIGFIVVAMFMPMFAMGDMVS
jgi:type IV pilus assembly protein PilC